MQKRIKAWHDSKWLVIALAILSLVFTLFSEDIREALPTLFGWISVKWLFDLLLTGGLLGLAIVLMLKSDRATRVCEDLREQSADYRKQLNEDFQKQLADYRKQLNEDFQKRLADHRKQLNEELPDLVDIKLKPISDAIATLESRMSALNSRLDALDSRITALKDAVGPSGRT